MAAFRTTPSPHANKRRHVCRNALVDEQVTTLFLNVPEEILRTPCHSAIILVAAASFAAPGRAQPTLGLAEEPQPGYYAQVQPQPAPQPPTGTQERRTEPRSGMAPAKKGDPEFHDSVRQPPFGADRERTKQPPFGDKVPPR